MNHECLDKIIYEVADREFEVSYHYYPSEKREPGGPDYPDGFDVLAVRENGDLCSSRTEKWLMREHYNSILEMIREVHELWNAYMNEVIGGY